MVRKIVKFKTQCLAGPTVLHIRGQSSTVMIVVKLDMSNEHGKVIVHVLNIKYLLQRN